MITALLVWLIAPGAAAEPTRRAEPGRGVAFDIMLPLRNRPALEGFVMDLHNPTSPNYRHWLTPTSFGLRFGPDTARINAVSASLRARGFWYSVQSRSVHVVAPASAVEAGFKTQLMVGLPAGGVGHVMEEQALTLPPEIASSGGQVFSFSRHIARKHAHVVTNMLNPSNRLSATGGYWFSDLKQAYSYPSIRNLVRAHDGTVRPLDGGGVTVGVLMSSDVYDSDIQAIFNHENWTLITGRPVPALYQRDFINGGATTASPELDEASLDVQQALSGAPGAHVVLYAIPDLSDGNVMAGYINIVEENRADIVSSSFGGCEQNYAPAYNKGRALFGVLAAEHEIFLQGNAQGITFIASSGDNAGKACPGPGYAAGNAAVFLTGVEVPAADPNVTAVGGTNLITTAIPGSVSSGYVGENGWADPEIPYDPDGVGALVSGGFWGAGGGYSTYFTKPWYQAMVRTGSPFKRAVPDIGMHVGGCPASIAQQANGGCNGGNLPWNGAGNTQRSYVIVAIGAGQPKGGFVGMIGTSVAAPEFAGATALLVEQLGRMGNLNPYLYRLAAAQAAGTGLYFHTNIPGYNGLTGTAVSAGYSLTTGVGTPIVSALVGAGNLELSGAPLSASNP